MLIIFFLHFSDEVMNKFSNLRTYFHKQNKKFNKSGSQSFGFVPKWEHFYVLQFLGDSLEPTQSSSNLEDSHARSPEIIDKEQEPPVQEFNESFMNNHDVLDSVSHAVFCAMFNINISLN